MKVINIITSSQPSTNPRAVKEAIALSKSFYQVNFVYSSTTSWASDLDQKIITENPEVNWIRAAGEFSNNELIYLFYRGRRKFYMLLYRLFKSTIFLENSLILYAQELRKVAKKIPCDLIIAHNIGTLPVAYKVSQLFSIPFIFDFEDFHRGESFEGSEQNTFNSIIEAQYVPFANNLTVSSDLINKAYNNIFRNKKRKSTNDVYNIEK